MKSSQPPSRELESLKRSREGLGQALKNLLTSLGYDARGVDDYLQKCDAQLNPGACNPSLDVVIKAGREVSKKLGWSRARLTFRRNRLLRAYRERHIQNQRIQFLEADNQRLKERLDLAHSHSSAIKEESERWRKTAAEVERVSAELSASLALAEKRASLAEDSAAALQRAVDELRQADQIKPVEAPENLVPAAKTVKRKRGAKVKVQLEEEIRPPEERRYRKRREF